MVNSENLEDDDKEAQRSLEMLAKYIAQQILRKALNKQTTAPKKSHIIRMLKTAEENRNRMLVGDKIPWLPQTNIENLIELSHTDVFFQSQQKEFEEMKKHEELLEMDNVRFRFDNRYEWRKTIDKVVHTVIHRDPFIFDKKLKEYKKLLKQRGNLIKPSEPKESRILIDLLWAYHNRYRVGKLKPKSIESHETALRVHLFRLNKDINKYTKNEIQDFLNTLPTRTAQICYYNLKAIFAEAAESGMIPRNIIGTLRKPIHKGEKGSWLTPTQQSKLMENLPTGILGKQILFYIMTGARLTEAHHTTIDFEKHVAYITRDKTEDSGVPITAMKLSPKFCELIREDWSRMFTHKKNWIGKQITDFFKSIGIYGKTTHDLRHTFSSNIYYLGIDPKKHQYLMAHTTIKISYDIYTTLDPTVKKQDILNIYGNLYPEF